MQLLANSLGSEIMNLETVQQISNSLPFLNIKVLWLNSRRIDTGAWQKMVFAFSKMQSLTTLHLTQTFENEAGLQTFADNPPPCLEILDLAANHINFETVNITGLLNNTLRSLGLNMNMITDVGLHRLGQQLKISKLTFFMMEINLAKTSSFSALVSQLPFATLETLDLVWNSLSMSDLFPLLSNLNQTRLHTLNLGLNNIGLGGVQLLASQLATANLTSLNLQNSQMQDDGIIAIAQQLNHSPLQKLALGHNQISDKGLNVLAQYLPFSKIHELELVANSITGNGLKKFLEKIIDVPLQSLRLDNNAINDIGAYALADYLPSSRLKTLSINSIGVTVEGINALSKSLISATLLENLFLGGNNLEENGTLALANHLISSHLKTLTLGGNKINDVGLEALAQALPTSLESLSVDGNLISSTGVKYLANRLVKQHCPALIAWSREMALVRTAPQTNLRSLGLSRNQIDTAGAATLCRILAATYIPIQYLDLTQNPINEDLVDIATCYISKDFNTPLIVSSSFLISRWNNQNNSQQLMPALPFRQSEPLIENKSLSVKEYSLPSIQNLAISSLQAPWPYLLLYRSYQFSRQLMSDSYQYLQALNSPEQSEALTHPGNKTLPPSTEKIAPISTQTIVAYGALYLTAGYILNEGVTRLSRWWQGGSAKPVYVETSTQQLTLLQSQLASVKEQLADFNPSRLTHEQQVLLNSLHYTVEDTEAQLDKLRQKGRATAEQLQILEDELSDTEMGLTELQQELREPAKLFGYYHGIRLFGTPATMPYDVESDTYGTARFDNQAGIRYE